MSDFFENVDPGNEIKVPAENEPVDIFEDEEAAEPVSSAEISEFMQDEDALSAAEAKYISDVEAYAARIIAKAEAESKKSADALKAEIFKELAQKKAENDAQCKEAEDRAASMIREAEETSAAADARMREAEDAVASAKENAEKEASCIIDAAKAEAEEIKLRAQIMLSEAKAERDKSLSEHARIESDGRDYLEVLERHAQARLNMISDLLKSEQEWAYKSKQHVEEITRVISELREKYEEDYSD